MNPELESSHYPNPEWERIADWEDTEPAMDALFIETLEIPLGNLVCETFQDMSWCEPNGIETDGYVRLGERGMEYLMILSNLAWEGRLPHKTYAFMFTMCGTVGDNRSPDWIPPIPRLQMPQIAVHPYDNKLPPTEGAERFVHYGLPNHTNSRQHAYSFLLHPACYEQMNPQTQDEVDFLQYREFPI